MDSTSDLYELEKATDTRITEILSFLHENFDKDETMLKSLRHSVPLTREDEESTWLDHERLIRTIFASSPCIVATEKSSGKIIGANLMIVTRNAKLDSKHAEGECAATPRTNLMKKYFHYLSEIGAKADLFARFPSAVAGVEFYAVAVDRSYRRMGIASALMQAGVAFARTHIPHAEFAFGIYTSRHSSKAAANLGFRSATDVDLLNYRDEHGRPIFRDTPPHNIVSVMVLPLR